MSGQTTASDIVDRLRRWTHAADALPACELMEEAAEVIDSLRREAGSRAITRIHVNQHVIRKNKKTGEREPVLTVKRGRSNTYCHSAHILGPSVVMYSPDCPLACGARVWVETRSPVITGDDANTPRCLECRKSRHAEGLAAVRAAEKDAEITPEIAAAMEGERNRATVNPKSLPTRAASHR